MNNIQIVPAIFATTEEKYRDRLRKVESSGAFPDGWIQLDIMDNKFVRNKSIGLDVIEKYPTQLKREVHLMVEYPENWIDELVRLGVERIIFPLEDDSGITERITHIKNHQVEVGLSLNPQTPLVKVEPFIDTIDLLLLMSVEPGQEGQKFLPETIDKIRQAKRLNRRFLIEVDGGIDKNIAGKVVAAGADNIVIGSHLINGNILENLEEIWEQIYRPEG